MRGVAADAAGRLLVVGVRDDRGIALLLGVESSQPLWSRGLAGRPTFVRTLPSGWLVGGAGGAGFVSLLDTDGATQWTYRVPDSSDSYFRDAAPDGAGGFWALGQFAGSAAGFTSLGHYDVLLVHLSGAGLSVEARHFGSAGGEQGRAVVALPDGTPVIAGEFGGALGSAAHPSIDFGSGPLQTRGDTDAFLAAPGRWVRTAGARGNDEYQALALLGSDVIAAGHTQPDMDYGPQNPHEVPTFQALLARYGPDGTLRWSRVAEGELTVLMAEQVEDGALYVAGHSWGRARFAGAELSAGAFLLKLDGEGRASRTYQCGAARGRRFAFGLALSHGAAAVVGGLLDDGGRMKPFLWRIR